MLRLIKIIVLAVIAFGLVILALANRTIVTLELLPQEIAGWVGISFAPIELPLFLVIFGGVAIGLLVGFIWEWLREHRHRAEASRERRARTKLEREVETLKGRSNEGQDEILALLDDGRRAG
ncbi:MAG: LapA family protein [Pseudomonadota bacterium]